MQCWEENLSGHRLQPVIGKEQRHRLKPVATSEVIILGGRVTSFAYDDNSNAKVRLSAQLSRSSVTDGGTYLAA